MLSWGHCTDESHDDLLLAAPWSLELKSEYLKWPLYNIFYDMDYVLYIQHTHTMGTPVALCPAN